MSLPLAKILPAALVSLALVASPSSCKKGSTGTGSEGICVIVDVHGPETLLPPGAEEAWVQGSVRISCTPSPTQMRTLLSLERKNPETGNWNQMQIGPPDEHIPDSTSYTFTVVFPYCLNGPWRMKAKITGTTPKGAPFKVDTPSPSSRIAC